MRKPDHATKNCVTEEARALNKAVGQALKEFRISNGFAQTEVSASHSHVSAIESGARSISIEKLQSIAAVVGTHPISIIARAYLILNESKDINDIYKLADQVHKDLEILANTAWEKIPLS